jgi:hypothetical protein
MGIFFYSTLIYMKMFKTLSNLLFLVLLSLSCFAQGVMLKNDRWELSTDTRGNISSLAFSESKSVLPFFREGNIGPYFYFIEGEMEVVPPLVSNNPTLRDGWYDDVYFSIEYREDEGRLLLLFKVRNMKKTPFQPTTLGIKTGLDIYMDHYPDWEVKYFPSLLRCESTHFWGYLMSPLGKIVALASPDPIASWSHEYSKSWGMPPYLFNGHRITSVNIDLINALPLPDRHPQTLWQIMPNEEKVFHLYFEEVKKLTDINKVVSEITKAPVIEMERTSIEKGREFSFSVIGPSDFMVEILKPDGKILLIENRNSTPNYKFRFNDTSQEGIYKIFVTAENFKKTQGTFYVRKPYSWYMDKAMQAVIDYPQKASKTHCESWYGFYSTFAGAKHMPDHPTLKKADEQFQTIFKAILDPVTLEPLQSKHRIQNISAMIGLLVDRYEVFRQKEDIEKAVQLSKYLMAAQSLDGAYRAGQIHYTSVLYIAKSMMELLEVLENSGLEREYITEYSAISVSVKRAIDELERSRTNIQTEGELTFEDGMISCSALQLATFALRQDDENEREKYKDAAIDILTQHECLQQLIVPDARMRSGTHRFWEAQYDVLMDNNFLNSPHGWSSWATYANYYAYLLTGEAKYLVRAFNGIDAAMQMIDLVSGEMRWGFMVNPYVKVTQITHNIPGAVPMDFPGVHYHALSFKNKKYIAGEQYIDMVSDWFFANSNDNDVHEHFKCLEEVALNKAYVVQIENENYKTFNCSVKDENGIIIIQPSEQLIDKIHLNFLESKELVIKFYNKEVIQKVGKGMTWINKH